MTTDLLCFTYELSPFTVICGFICELCKDLCQELLILLHQGKKNRKNKTRLKR